MEAFDLLDLVSRRSLLPPIKTTATNISKKIGNGKNSHNTGVLIKLEKNLSN